MAKLFVANCTRQRHEFIFRAPEQKNPQVKVIEIGGQSQIWNDSPIDQLRNIVEQHEMYGLIPVSEIDRTRRFVGYCYSFDKPIDVDKIMYTVENNDVVLTADALESRKQSAQIINQSLSQVAAEAGNGLKNLDVEIKEIATPGKDVAFDETITVENRGNGRGRPRRNT
jgi:hypothetical protein